MSKSSTNGLFRKEAQQARRVPMLGEIVLSRPPSLAFLVCFVSTGAVALVLLFSVGKYTRRMTVDGVIMPDKGLIELYAPRPGVVIRKTAAEGQRVARGALLYTISTDLQSVVEGKTLTVLIEQAARRKRLLEQDIERMRVLHEHERTLLTGRVRRLRVELAGIETQMSSQSARVALAEDSAARYASLLAQDAGSTDHLQQRQADSIDQQLALARLRREHASAEQELNETFGALKVLPLKQQTEVSHITQNVIDVRRTLVELEAGRELAVTAPEGGSIAALYLEPGQSTNPTQPVAAIVPDASKWQAHLFVPTDSAGSVRVGDSIRIRYRAFPHQKFGQYPARVVSIARSALSSSEIAALFAPTIQWRHEAGSFYRVIAALEVQSIATRGKLEPLQAGMTLQADILQDRRRLYEWALDPLHRLATAF